MTDIEWSVVPVSPPDAVGFDPELCCYVCQNDDGSHHRLFTSRYYASKWIEDLVPDNGQKMWRVFEIDGYFRVFRYIEYDF